MPSDVGARRLAIVIACLNGERRLPGLLQSIRDQEYDQSLIDVVLVDDDSSDRTVEVAKSYGARVLRNGDRNIERGKSIGFQATTDEYVMFIDDDNRLPHPRWLGRAMEALVANPDAVGVQAAWFRVKPNDPAVNRYCSIFGIGDPLAMYLRRKDHLACYEREWTLPGSVTEETDAYWKVRFSPSSFLTIGSQGFIARASLVRKTTWKPYLFHIDTNYELVLQGYDTFLMLKDEVEHDYCTSISSLVGKKRRDLRLFLRQHALRTFRWQTPPLQFGLALATMVTLVEPAYVALRAFRRTGDPACLLHPVLCAILPFVYGAEVLRMAVVMKAREPRTTSL
jgi:glycosyltransferase involved in cell wall biosynthesis